MEEINYDDFTKLDLRVGEIKVAEEIEGADKLLKLTVDTGEDNRERIICAGVKEFYSAEELVGRQIVVICNLASREMRGVTSNGMLLAAGDGRPYLLQPDSKVENGSKVA